MTQRFGDIKEGEEYSIINPAGPEPERPSAPARVASTIRRTVAEGSRKNATLAAFVAGLLTGSTLTIVSGLLR
jgi:hypothetical protein